MSEKVETNKSVDARLSDFVLQQNITSDWAIVKSEYAKVKENFAQINFPRSKLTRF